MFGRLELELRLNAERLVRFLQSRPLFEPATLGVGRKPTSAR